MIVNSLKSDVKSEKKIRLKPYSVMSISFTWTH